MEAAAFAAGSENTKDLSARILILTVPHGAAHNRLAETLRAALLRVRPELTVQMADGLAPCAGWFGAYYNSYQIPLRYFPALWSWIENLQHQSQATSPGALYRLGGQGLFRFIERFDPDAVIATEVGMCELAALYKRRSRAPYRLVAAHTGLDVDRAWAQPEVDLYVTAPGDCGERLKAAGAPPEKILACGPPVDPAFELPGDPAALRERLGLERNVPLLLVLFGGTGMGKSGQVVKELKKIQHPMQAVFIAGRNARLEKKLRRLCAGRARWRVFGWVSNMPEWMRAADLLVSKPGAGTLVEALASGLPLVAVDPLPGNERRACDWIEKNQTGIFVSRPAELAPAIERLLDQPSDLRRFRENARAAVRPGAAGEAAKAILRLLDNRR